MSEHSKTTVRTDSEGRLSVRHTIWLSEKASKAVRIRAVSTDQTLSKTIERLILDSEKGKR